MGSGKSVIQELHRRRVFRVMAVYGVVGFVALQVVKLGTTAWGVPTSVLTWSIWIVVGGAPLAGWLTWLFDITPWGILKTPPTGALPMQPTGLIDRRVEFLIIGVLLLALGFGIRGMIGDIEDARLSAAPDAQSAPAGGPGQHD